MKSRAVEGQASMLPSLETEFHRMRKVQGMSWEGQLCVFLGEPKPLILKQFLNNNGVLPFNSDF